MEALIIIAIVILILVIMFISMSNKLARAVVKIDEAESGIDVALTKRYDTLTKQLDIVKAYAKHETETFEKVISLRKGMPISEKQSALSQMDEMQKQINVVAENYPELRSSENFRTLQISVNDAEEHLQAARRVYNSNVSSYNQMIVTFPMSAVAGARNFKPREFFEAESSKKNDVLMKF